MPGAGGWTQVDLNAQRPGGSLFRHPSEAFNINESAQIVGLGAVDCEGRTHAFLLTQGVPEPPVWLPTGLRAIGLALRRLGWPGTPAAA